MPSSSPAVRSVRWGAVVGATAAVGFAGAAVGVPSAAMFAGLAVGLVFALRTDWGLDLPPVGQRLSQGVLGVSLGTLVHASTLTELGRHALPIVGVMLATLLATVLAGLAMSRLTGLDRPTAAFGMVAGGASGIVAISRELGADERLVAVMQYLRVLLIVVLAPVVAGLASSGDGAPAAGAAAGGSWSEGLLTAAVCLAAGTLLARAV
ncbi:AbrB family transcriptional regulator, partial [Patulibacter sp. S7RM1-6]